MRIELPTLEGRFLRRYKRFLADVELADGSVVTAHCPNTGSLRGLPGGGHAARSCATARTPRASCATRSRRSRSARTLVNVDTSLPNHVVHEAIVAGTLPELAGYDEVRREVTYGRNSRIDLLLASKRSRKLCYVEVKSTTLAEGRTALFPDAVTERGRKHLVELEGGRGRRATARCSSTSSAAPTCAASSPADEIDPAYGAACARRPGPASRCWPTARASDPTGSRSTPAPAGRAVRPARPG